MVPLLRKGASLCTSSSGRIRKKCGKGGEMDKHTVRSLEEGCHPGPRFRLQKGVEKRVVEEKGDREC